MALVPGIQPVEQCTKFLSMQGDENEMNIMLCVNKILPITNTSSNLSNTTNYNQTENDYFNNTNSNSSLYGEVLNTTILSSSSILNESAHFFSNSSISPSQSVTTQSPSPSVTSPSSFFNSPSPSSSITTFAPSPSDSVKPSPSSSDTTTLPPNNEVKNNTKPGLRGTNNGNLSKTNYNNNSKTDKTMEGALIVIIIILCVVLLFILLAFILFWRKHIAIKTAPDTTKDTVENKKIQATTEQLQYTNEYRNSLKMRGIVKAKNMASRRISSLRRNEKKVTAKAPFIKKPEVGLPLPEDAKKKETHQRNINSGPTIPPRTSRQLPTPNQSRISLANIESIREKRTKELLNRKNRNSWGNAAMAASRKTANIPPQPTELPPPLPNGTHNNHHIHIREITKKNDDELKKEDP